MLLKPLFSLMEQVFKNKYYQYVFYSLLFTKYQKNYDLLKTKTQTFAKGLSQKLLIKQMAQSFAMQFSTFWQNKRKKPRNEAKMSMTKRGSSKPSIFRVIQFRRELV